MKVRFNTNFATLYLVLGVVLLLLHLWVLSIAGDRDGTGVIRLIVPLMLVTISILYFTKDYFELRDKELIVYSPFGFVQKTYSFNHYSDFVLDGKKVFLNTAGKLVRVRINKLTANQHHWAQFINIIQGNDLTNELHNIQ